MTAPGDKSGRNGGSDQDPMMRRGNSCRLAQHDRRDSWCESHQPWRLTKVRPAENRVFADCAGVPFCAFFLFSLIPATVMIHVVKCWYKR